MTNWKIKDKQLRSILDRNNDPENEQISISNTKKELIPYLQNTPHFASLPRAIIHKMQEATTFHTFNRALDRVWDFADDNLIWIEF